LFHLKQNSAIGRLLIWETTWNIAKKHLVFGSGDGSFLTTYMPEQAHYFITHGENRYAWLADRVVHPFNEYLLLVVEYGLVGLLILIFGLILLVSHSQISSPYALCLLSIAIFSLFSYPLRYPFNWVVIAYCITRVSGDIKPILRFTITRKLIKTSWFIAVVISLFFVYKDAKWEYQWNVVAKESLSGNTEAMLPYYSKLYKSWNGDCLFLYNYGAELNYIQKYSLSNIVLTKSSKYLNDYDTQILLGDNYFNLKEFKKATVHYYQASKMCPNRIIPIYMLHKISVATGNNSYASYLANKILHKKVKVPSTIISIIKNEMKSYLSE